MNTGDGSFQKARNNPLAKLLFGQGLNGLDGEEWALHRRIANQAFMIERVKVSLFALNMTASFLVYAPNLNFTINMTALAVSYSQLGQKSHTRLIA